MAHCSFISNYHSSSSCSERIRFDSCSLYPQNEIGPSISSSVVLCVFVLLFYIVVLFFINYLFSMLYCSACLGILFVSILCMCCSHFSWYCFISFTLNSDSVFSLIQWFFSLSSFVIPRSNYH